MIKAVDNSGWQIQYEEGSRLADIYTPSGSCVDCVQVRPWDFTRSPYEQDTYEVTERILTDALHEYLSDQGLASLA